MDLGPMQPLLAGLITITFITGGAELGLTWLWRVTIGNHIESSGHDL